MAGSSWERRSIHSPPAGPRQVLPVLRTSKVHRPSENVRSACDCGRHPFARAFEPTLRLSFVTSLLHSCVGSTTCCKYICQRQAFALLGSLLGFLKSAPCSTRYSTGSSVLRSYYSLVSFSSATEPLATASPARELAHWQLRVIALTTAMNPGPGRSNG